VLHDADWVKLNQSELLALCPDSGDLETTMSNFCQHYALETLVVTLGEQGALACDQQGKRYSVKPVAAIPVVDTVGAGDAFAAVLLLGLQQEWPLEMTLQRAQALASALVGRRGATVADKTFYELVSQDWS
jgi:fructokinase